MELFSLVGCPLFAGVPEGEWESLLSQVGARERPFQRGRDLALRRGAYPEHGGGGGVVLAGRVTVEHHDFWGNRSVLDSLGPGKVFAETYALLPEEPLQVSVTGAEAGKALFLSPGKLGKDPRAAPEPAAAHRGEKPAALPADLPHLLQDHPGPGAFLSLLRGGEERLPGVYHPLYPAAAGGLLGGGPQRLVPRAGEHGPGGAAAHHPVQVYLAGKRGGPAIKKASLGLPGDASLLLRNDHSLE